MQFYIKCDLADGLGNDTFVMPQFPVRLRLGATPCRLGGDKFWAMHECTSDEVCLQMARMNLTWSFIPLT